MGCSCRDLPGGFCLGTVTAPDSQHHLKRSRAQPPPIQPVPRHCALAQGKRLVQKQGTGIPSITLRAAKATPLWLCH